MPAPYVMPYHGEFHGETTFFVDTPVEGVPASFAIKGMPLVPKGMKVYLHPDTRHDGLTGETHVFTVVDSSLSMRAQAPVDKEYTMDGKRYVLPESGVVTSQEVILRLVKRPAKKVPK